ncbi:MAG: hypothetical protein M5U35_01020 [Roseovarius sp.]|nr:hypothetical protein [Roseovarius sp.]
MIAWRLRRRLAVARHHRRRRGPLRAPFSGDAARRLLILSIDHRIPQSQIFPFHYYARAIRARFDCDIREVEAASWLAGEALPEGATTVAFQTAIRHQGRRPCPAHRRHPRPQPRRAAGLS